MAYLEKWEEEITDFVKKYYQAFFDKNKFKTTSKNSEKAESGQIIYTDSSVAVKVVNTKGKYGVEVGQIDGNLFWSLDLIKSSFKITDYKIDEDDRVSRKRALLDTFKDEDYSANASFLIANFNRIKTMFSSGNGNETRRQLERLSLEKQKYV